MRGKQNHSPPMQLQVTDHPRRCGENSGKPPKSGTGGRITPAGAGKTHIRKKCAWKVWDHPRRCGENPDIVLTDSFAKGSPRRCGENMIPPCRLCVNTGSPPQVRGKRWKMGPEITGRRITPAGAGKTDFYKIRQKTFKDHPRRCGENTLRAALYEFPPGSPPQVRGKPFRNDNFRCNLRITPAGAGKTETYTFCGIEI